MKDGVIRTRLTKTPPTIKAATVATGTASQGPRLTAIASIVPEIKNVTTIIKAMQNTPYSRCNKPKVLL